MNPCPKWSATGRWSFDGERCFALLTDWKQAQWGDRLIYGRPAFVVLETHAKALRRRVRSWVR